MCLLNGTWKDRAACCGWMSMNRFVSWLLHVVYMFQYVTQHWKHMETNLCIIYCVLFYLIHRKPLVNPFLSKYVFNLNTCLFRVQLHTCRLFSDLSCLEGTVSVHISRLSQVATVNWGENVLSFQFIVYISLGSSGLLCFHLSPPRISHLTDD